MGKVKKGEITERANGSYITDLAIGVRFVHIQVQQKSRVHGQEEYRARE